MADLSETMETRSQKYDIFKALKEKKLSTMNFVSGKITHQK